jgi:hypothetical protein
VTRSDTAEGHFDVVQLFVDLVPIALQLETLPHRAAVAGALTLGLAVAEAHGQVVLSSRLGDLAELAIDPRGWVVSTAAEAALERVGLPEAWARGLVLGAETFDGIRSLRTLEGREHTIAAFGALGSGLEIGELVAEP